MNPEKVRAFHGSGTSIEQFSYEFLNRGNDQLGSGWYFTTSLEEAESYTGATVDDLPKLGGSDNPTVHVVELSFNKLLEADAIDGLTVKQVDAIVRRSPMLDEALENWGEVEREGREKVIRRAIAAYAVEETAFLITLNQLSNDFFGDHLKEFNEAIRDVTGYDGVYQRYEDKTHYVAWFQDQITILDRLSPEQKPPKRALRPGRS